MQKRVGIITITDGCNYGNRLQNFALQTTLEELGVSVETLQRRNYHDRTLMQQLIYFGKTVVKKGLRIDFDAPKRKRKKNFRQFNQKYIKFSSDILSYNKAPSKLADKYDYFFVGSDQVWNPMFRIIQEDIDNYFAAFAPREKKFSYAASFGISEIPTEYREYYSRQLKTFSRISVREEKGVEIVKELSGQEARAVCDPTFLVETEKWKSIMEKPGWMNEKERFLVTYFLGEADKEVLRELDSYAMGQDCRVIRLESEFISGRLIKDEDSFAAPPQEFLWLICHAQAVVTDSFHACVFSILFGRPFQVFSRVAIEANNKMGSRIETMLGRYNLLERMEYTSLKESLLSQGLDRETIKAAVMEERKNGISFLRECMELLTEK